MANLQFWRSNQMSDDSFLDLVKRTFGKTFTKGIDAKNWLITNGYYTSYPDIVTDGLVLYLDAANSSSFKGEPTTNLSYNNGNSGSEYLASIRDWVNSGSWTSNTNETDVQKPIVSIPNLRILSGIVTVEGNIHFGCSYTNVLPSTTYSVSVYFRQNRAGSTSPYIRTNVNNNSLGNLTYNGDTNSANWPVNEWIRITGTCTTQSNENGIYISNYLTYVGDKIWYFGHQVEEKSYVTHLVAGTRGTTYATGGGWCDLSGNGNHGELVNSPLYDSSNLGNVYFNGSNKITSLISSTFDMYCLEVAFKPYKQITSNTFPDNNEYTLLGIRRATSNDNIIGLFEWTGSMTNETVSIWSEGVYATGIVDTISLGFHIMTFNWNGNSYDIWLDGVKKSTIQRSNGHAQLLTGVTYVDLGYGYNYYNKGNISHIKLYNRTLLDSEVIQNFNATKERFGL